MFFKQKIIKWRSNRKSFNCNIEFRSPPPLLKGTKILLELENFENEFRKKQKKKSDGPWKKRSILFDLPY